VLEKNVVMSRSYREIFSSHIFLCVTNLIKAKEVKQSRYRPGEAQKVPES